ncbi:hypothetical protein BH10PSE4_BH10PSE4_30200 [soil metagenome]
MLTAKTNLLDYVEAKDASRAMAFHCRGCEKPVILHAGKIRPWHFQHHPDVRCAFGAKMSAAHLDTQRALAAAFRARGAYVELESWLPGLAGDRRIDVLVHPPGQADRRIAIEVQQVDITVEAIAARSQCYRAQGVAPLWLRLLNFDRLETADRIDGTGEIWIDKYSIRSWERWAHDELGALWFCDAGTGLIWRGRFTKAYGFREASEFYSAGGDYNSFSGGYSELSRFGGLALDGPYRAADLRLTRGGSLTRRRAITGKFLAPQDAPPASQALRRQLRVEQGNTYPWEICELEQRVDDCWRAAVTRPAGGAWRRGSSLVG